MMFLLFGCLFLSFFEFQRKASGRMIFSEKDIAVVLSSASWKREMSFIVLQMLLAAAALFLPS